MTSREEIILIKRIRNGEADLFREVVTLHSSRILSLVRGIVENREDAEEIAQDVFVKAFFSIGSFRGDSSLSTWLYRIAYNMSLSFVRKNKKRHIPVDLKMALNPKYESPLDEEIKDKEYTVLYNTIKKLPPDDRFIITEFYLHDKSIGEISAVNGMSEINIKVRLHRLRKKMGTDMKEKMDMLYGYK